MKGLNVKNTGGIMPKFRLFQHPNTHMYYIMRRADEMTPNAPAPSPTSSSRLAIATNGRPSNASRPSIWPTVARTPTSNNNHRGGGPPF